MSDLLCYYMYACTYNAHIVCICKQITDKPGFIVNNVIFSFIRFDFSAFSQVNQSNSQEVFQTDLTVTVWSEMIVMCCCLTAPTIVKRSHHCLLSLSWLYLSKLFRVTCVQSVIHMQFIIVYYWCNNYLFLVMFLLKLNIHSAAC